MDPLAFTPDELEELLADACRKAYRKGVKAATRKFDTLLSRHYRKHQLESLNGTTGEFVEEARQELKSLTVLKRRDATGHDHAADGKFAPKGGGGDGKQNGNTVSAKEGAPPKDVAANPGVGNAAPAQHDAPTEEHLLDGLHEVVPAGQWHRVKAAVTRAGQKIYEKMVLATPAFLKVQHLMTAIEGPDDLKRFGYKPMFDGVSGHDTPDALKDATGLGGTLGAKLAAHVLTKVVFWLKDRAGLAKAMDDSDHFADAAEMLADIFAVLAEEFGGEAPDAKTVEDALRNLDGDHDPHAGAAVALIDHAIAAAEAGEDVQPGLDRIIDLLDSQGEEEVEKASWDSAKHPRDDAGRFVSRDAIADAKGDPAKEAALRERVTDPAERKKLDAALGGESDLGRTKRGQARADAAERRKTRQASKEKATEVLRRIRANGEVTADDVRDLADHLPALTVAELRLHREALMAKLGGKRVKDQYVRSLVEHARGKAGGEAEAVPDAVPDAGGEGAKPGDAAAQLQKLNEAYQRHLPDARKLADTQDGAAALMRKWGETRIIDAIHQEAKSRSIAELQGGANSLLTQENAQSPPIPANSPPIPANSGGDANTSATPDHRQPHEMTADERRREVERIKRDEAAVLSTPLMSEGAISPTQINRMGNRERERWRENTMRKMELQSRISELQKTDDVLRSEQSARARSDAESRARQRSAYIDDILTMAGPATPGKPNMFRNAKGELKPKYQRAVDASRAKLAEAVAEHPDLAEQYARHLLAPAAPDAATDVAPAKPTGDTPPAPTGEKPVTTAKPKTTRTKKPPAAPFSAPESEAAFAAELERDKTHAGTLAEREQQVEGFLGTLRAKHSDDELKALAKKVTGRGGNSAKQALDYLRADLLAVSRVLESQKV